MAAPPAEQTALYQQPTFRDAFIQELASRKRDHIWEHMRVLDVHTPALLNVTLPPSGTVSGNVYTADGSVAPFAEVALSSSVLFRDNFVGADSQGHFTFNRAPVGPFSLQATDENFTVFVTVNGNLTNAGDTVTINIILPATGSVSGTIFGTDGATPVPNASVRVENIDSTGPQGFYLQRINADGNGSYSLGNVPVGNIRVSSADPSNSNSSGFALARIAANQNSTVNVVLGQGFAFFRPGFFNFNLDGSNVVTGNLVVISGQLPAIDGKVAVTGKLSWGVSIEQGKEAIDPTGAYQSCSALGD